MRASHLDDLVRLVQNAIEAGYAPQGGHQAVVVREQLVYSGRQQQRADSTIEYSQTMIKP